MAIELTGLVLGTNSVCVCVCLENVEPLVKEREGKGRKDMAYLDSTKKFSPPSLYYPQPGNKEILAIRPKENSVIMRFH